MISENKSVLTIPHDFEAEQSVIGAIFYDNSLFDEVGSILTPNSFHEETHKQIFRAIIELCAESKPIDEVIIGDKLKELGKLEDCGGYAYLAELVDCVPSSGNIVYYAKIIQEHALLRDLIRTTSDIGIKARDPQQSVKELINEAIEKVTAIRIEENHSEPIKDILMRNFDRLEHISANKGEITGTPTGFVDINRMMSGLQPTDLIILAARPSMGKTSLALNIASYVAIKHQEMGAVLMFSLEMSKEQLGMRLLSSESKIDNKKLRSGNFEQEDWDKLGRATDIISGSSLIIDDRSSITVQEIISTVRHYDKKLKYGVGPVVVDYLQLMSGNKSENRDQQLGSITRALKGLAKDLGIPVILLSQLNRALENRSDKRPKLSDLRESGSIEQDADIVIFVYRDEVYNENTDKKGIAEIIFSKHRNGPTGMAELVFQGKYTRFFNMSQINQPPRSFKETFNPNHFNEKQ